MAEPSPNPCVRDIPTGGLCRDFASVPNALAQLAPDAPLFECEGRVWSRAQFACETHNCARMLIVQHGIKPFDRVAYLGLNHPHQVALLFALASLQAVLVPLNWRLASAELRTLMADCSPKVLLTDATWLLPARALASSCAVPCAMLASMVESRSHALPDGALANDTAGAAASVDGVEVSCDLDALPQHTAALLVYTSGTTGQPKGAVHTHGQLLANMRAATSAMGLQADDVIATVLPLFHVGGLCIHTLPALWCGARVLLAPRFEASQTLGWAHAARFTQLLMVPATLRALAEHTNWNATQWPGVRGVWAGASTVPDALIEVFHARGVPVGNVYGATETGPVSLVLPLHLAASHRGSSGYAAPCVDVILAPLARDRPPGYASTDVSTGVGEQPLEGEICVRGPNVVQRYWPNIATCDPQGFFHTGDIGRRGDSGDITVVGRCKDMVISGGENIYPAEIEAILCTHVAVGDCAVVGLPNASWGEVLVAVVVPKNLSGLVKGGKIGTLSNIHDALLLQNKEQLSPALAQLESALAAHLAAHLAAFKLPRQWLWCSSLPKTALGKVQKPAVRDAVLKRLTGSNGPV